MLSSEQLIQSLTDTAQSSIARSSAIATLASQGQGVEALIAVLADSDSTIRREAAMALQRLNATQAADPLMTALQVESNDLTLWAMLEAVSELATPDALPALESIRTTGSILTRIEVKKSEARIQARYGNGTPESPGPEITPDPPRPQAATVDIEPEPTEPDVPTPQEVEPPQDDPFVALIEDAASTEPPEEVVEPTEDEEQPRVFIEAIFSGPPLDPDREADPVGEEMSEDEAFYEDEEMPEDEAFYEDEEMSEDASDVSAMSDDLVEEIAEADLEDAIAVDVDEAADTFYDEHYTDEAESDDDEASAESTGTDAVHREKESQEIDDLADSIAYPSRLAGSSGNLPVLAPSAATVPYHPQGSALEPVSTNFFLTLIHPGRYLSKRWVQRTRVYLLLWAVLLIGTFGFIHYQRSAKTEIDPSSRFGVSMSDLPELVKRSLAEGDFYIQEGYYRKAINSYELTRDLESLPLSVYRKLGFAYFKEGQYALAAEAYELFLEAKANDHPDIFAAEASLFGVSPLTSLGEGTTRDYETYNILGTAYKKLGRVLEAQRAYEKAIRLAPKYGEAYNNLARLYADDYPDPLPMDFGDRQTEEFWARNPVLQTSPRLRMAETLAYTAVTLNPDVAAYHNTLGWVLSKRGQMNKAIKTLERAIDLQGDAVETHYHLAQVALKANEREKAVKAIRNVFKLNPAFVSVTNVPR